MMFRFVIFLVKLKKGMIKKEDLKRILINFNFFKIKLAKL